MGTISGKRGKDGIFSTAIDPLLLQGGYTVNELAELLATQFAGQFSVDKIKNNIRTRIINFRKKGFVFEETSTRRNRKIRLVAPQATSVA